MREGKEESMKREKERERGKKEREGELGLDTAGWLVGGWSFVKAAKDGIEMMCHISLSAFFNKVSIESRT